MRFNSNSQRNTKDWLLIGRITMKFISAILAVGFIMLSPVTGFAQETSDQAQAPTEPLGTSQANRELSAQEREARRAQMRARIDSLSDEERAAIQQKRQSRMQSHRREHQAIKQTKRKNGADSDP
ncbi:MAG: TolA-binding protein [Pseudohongiellaceae bacterium]